jgi:uncharacterized protein YjeT (DUF2065 family)
MSRITWIWLVLVVAGLGLMLASGPSLWKMLLALHGVH